MNRMEDERLDTVIKFVKIDYNRTITRDQAQEELETLFWVSRFYLIPLILFMYLRPDKVHTNSSWNFYREDFMGEILVGF